MSFTNTEKTNIRKHCGYPAFGSNATAFMGHRFFTSYGSMEYILNNLSVDEEAQARVYVTSLDALEIAILTAGTNMGTASAAVWTRNAREMADRENLYGAWRVKLCQFLGIPPGPAVGGGANVAVMV